MGATLEILCPSLPGAGSIGTEDFPWGEGHFAALYLNGSAVAALVSPTFTGTPTGPTASPGTNTTQLATTAYALAAANAVKNRGTHTGTQLANTISDFAAAVAALPAGAKAHDQNTDTKLANGTSNQVTAADLRAHLDDNGKHREINDSATSSTGLWSSTKIAAYVAAAITAYDEAGFTVGDIEGLGALAEKDSVATTDLDDEAVTAVKLAGGTADPGILRYYGTNSLNEWGFFALPGTPKASPGPGEGAIGLDEDGIFVLLGTTANAAAAGDDSRFPTSSQKAALAGSNGTPSGSNKYLTEDWKTAAALSDAAVLAGTATTPGLVTAAQLKAAVEEHESEATSPPSLSDADITTGTATTPSLITAAQAKLAVDTYRNAGLVILTHTLASGTNAGSAAATTWETRPINTENTDTHNLCSLSSNDFTLPAGTYEIEAWSAGFQVNAFACRLYNVTDAGVVSGVISIPGMSAAGASWHERSYSHLRGVFTLAASKALRIQQYSAAAKASSGLGAAVSITGVSEIHAQIVIRKL